MGIKLLPVALEDAATMLEVGMAAFANDDLVNAQFSLRSSTPEQLEEYKKWRSELFKARMSRPGKLFVKAVDDSTNAFVGYVGLFAPHTQPPDPSSIPRPAHLNTEISNELETKMKSVKEKHIGERDDVWYVQSMVVHPHYQGQGIATMLLQRGLEEADKAGQAVYLEATPTGKKLYQRCGFEIVEEIHLESVDYTLLAMIRHPRTSDA